MRILLIVAAALGLSAVPAGAAKVAIHPGCEFILGAGQQCLAPFPDDYYTRADHHTATGRRVDLRRSAMPANTKGVHVDPAGWNRNDGFSPGITIVVRVPGLDNEAAFRRTGLVGVARPAQYRARNQPVVVIDAKTHRRWPIWAELDSNAASDGERNLEIHPARNFLEGHRYIVAFRHLRTASGKAVKATAPFRIYRDRLSSGQRAVNQRRGHFEQVFRALRRAHVARRDLYAAWDFTIASRRSLSERALAIRNDAFAKLGDKTMADRKVQGRAPAFQVTKVTDFTRCDTAEGTPCPAGTDRDLMRQVEGTFDVPCYLTSPDCKTGQGFNYGRDGLPHQRTGNLDHAPFVCNIPFSAAGGQKLQGSLYGHGLFGDVGETRRSRNVHQLGDENKVLVCATDWQGMADEDVPTGLQVLLDLSKFPVLADRLQQGFLNFDYLARLLVTADGFASDPAFRVDGASVVDTSSVAYYGNSQGGVLGGAFTALSPDVTRSVLYVPAMTYSVLLPRSVDFDDPEDPAAFADVLYGRPPFDGSGGYPDTAVHPLILDLMQMLWDRGDPSGYAQHMTRDPLPGTPAHHVLIEMAIGDHQVSNLQAEVEARTIGAKLRMPAYDPGRTFDADAAWGLGTLGALPRDDNAIIPWDIGPLRQQDGNRMGTNIAPEGNVPPAGGQDPHDYVIRNSPAIRRQIAEYMRPGGQIIDVCDAKPCRTPDWTG
ncbi:MAG: hypothetical protein E6G41_04325 [Actinobacteria bacterium]|nr:MAG: hypothetical protein E6G41_04325 [Actinomycetota bacterium]